MTTCARAWLERRARLGWIGCAFAESVDAVTRRLASTSLRESCALCIIGPAREYSTLANINRSRRALPNSNSRPSSLALTSNPNSEASLASSSRPTLLLPTVSLPARRRLSNSSTSKPASKDLVDLMASLEALALFLDTVVWVALLRRRLDTACLRMALLRLAKVSLRRRPAHSPRTTSLCRLARLASSDLLRCKALARDRLEVAASKVHPSLLLAKDLSRRTTSLWRCLVRLPRPLRPRLPLLHLRLNRSLLPPPLLRPRRLLSRRPRRSQRTAALPCLCLHPMQQPSLLSLNKQHRPPRQPLQLPRSRLPMPMPRTPLLPPLLPLWQSLRLQTSNSSSSRNNRLEETWTTSPRK